MPLSRQSVGTYPETSLHATGQEIFGQSSQSAEPLWTDRGIKSEISVCELNSTLNKAQAGNERSNILPKSLQARKKPPFTESAQIEGFMETKKISMWTERVFKRKTKRTGKNWHK